MGGCHGHQSPLRSHRGFLFDCSKYRDFVAIAGRLTGPARILLFRKKFVLRARIWKKAFALGLFAGEFAHSFVSAAVSVQRPSCLSNLDAISSHASAFAATMPELCHQSCSTPRSNSWRGRSSVPRSA
jgi:hypothetical protein